jgi:hypothetical protein
MVSKKYATLTVQPDGSVLASGDKPNNDVYDVELPTDLKRITALRLEVLPDPSLPEGGPGRAPLFQVGDFLLTEFQVSAAPTTGRAAPRRVAFGRVSEEQRRAAPPPWPSTASPTPAGVSWERSASPTPQSSN